MDQYYKNIRGLIENNLVEIKKTQISNNYHTLLTYYNVGKLLIKAQGGEKRAKYGEKLIKQYSAGLSKEFGSGYDYTNLFRMKQFYLCYRKVGPPGQQLLTWTHYRILLPIKDENKRNYYINSTIEHGLSKRKLIEYIKSNAYERLLKKDDIKLKYIDNNKNEETDILDMIKNPIFIKINEKIDKITERALKKFMLAQIEDTLLELGRGFFYGGSEVPIRLNGRIHRPDLVFFNTELNAYVLFELKIRNLRKEDIGQLEFYVNYYDSELKKHFHSPTIGITITKKVDIDIIKYNEKDNIKHTTYKLIE